MENKIQVFNYENTPIEFDLSSKNVMINAYQMAKPFGKLAKDFLKTEQTEAFIQAWLKHANKQLSETAIKDNYPLLGRSSLFISRKNAGTWMHPQLALKFAAWLSPDFEVWVYSTIEKILTDGYNKRNGVLETKTKTEIEIEKLQAKLRDTDIFKEIEQLKQKTVLYNKELKKLDKEIITNQLPLWVTGKTIDNEARGALSK